jgi:hypothetical protein
MQYPPDHSLPLVQLKERRREMVVALQNRAGRVGEDELRQLATIQQAIAAIEDVIADLDCEIDETFPAVTERQVMSLPLFGRRTIVHSPG